MARPTTTASTSIAFTARLGASSVDASVGTVGDAYDDARAETMIGLFKTELIKLRGRWRTAEQVELATLESVGWFTASASQTARRHAVAPKHGRCNAVGDLAGRRGMPSEHQSVSDTIGWLSFPRNAYPNFYLNTERIGHRFHSYLGSIREFSESVERSGEADASVKALFFEAGFKGGLGGGKEVQWDLADPLAQVLVLRAYLTTVGDLRTNARSAPMTDFVLARGQGGLVLPAHVIDSPLWHQSGVSPDVVAEIAAEQQRQARIGTTVDPLPLYWAAYSNTEEGLVVSLLGDASLIGTDVRSYSGLDMTYCIFGQKIRDWQSWTLLSPLHVWVEPPGKPTWG